MDSLRDLSYKSAALVTQPWLSVSAWRKGLRVLAYHGVADPKAFDAQMAFLATRLDPVSAEEVVSGDFASRRLPVWVTFDDGARSLVDTAMPLLDEYNIAATAFVCPGFVDSSEPFWWEVVRAAVASGVEIAGGVSPRDVGWLKRVPDAERRRRVEEIRIATEAHLGRQLVGEHLDTPGLKRWISHGHSVGNHTWDHPLLDMTDPETQAQQIVRAHDWLIEALGLGLFLFAYPNGNHSSIAEGVLRELGYSVGALFNHRIHRGGDLLRMSRIRVSAETGLAEFKAKVSGIHPMAHRLRGRS